MIITNTTYMYYVGCKSDILIKWLKKKKVYMFDKEYQLTV